MVIIFFGGTGDKVEKQKTTFHQYLNEDDTYYIDGPEGSIPSEASRLFTATICDNPKSIQTPVNQGLKHITDNYDPNQLTTFKLVGHSRGAVGILRLLNEIQKNKNIDTKNIKFEILLLDPVAGPALGDVESARNIPEIVYKARIIYSGEENRLIMHPQGPQKIVFNAEKTDLKFLTLPGRHSDLTKDTNNGNKDTTIITSFILHEFIGANKEENPKIPQKMNDGSYQFTSVTQDDLNNALAALPDGTSKRPGLCSATYSTKKAVENFCEESSSPLTNEMRTIVEYIKLISNDYINRNGKYSDEVKVIFNYSNQILENENFDKNSYNILIGTVNSFIENHPYSISSIIAQYKEIKENIKMKPESNILVKIGKSLYCLSGIHYLVKLIKARLNKSNAATQESLTENSYTLLRKHDEDPLNHEVSAQEGGDDPYSDGDNLLMTFNGSP